MGKTQFRIYEHLHIPFWLVKDTCWALELKEMGTFMIVPTLSLAILIAVKSRKNVSELLPNAAIALWITANSMWMCDEFFVLGIKKFCVVPFGIGLMAIGYWLIAYFPTIWKMRREGGSFDR
jgi:hypothetical protein